jgi:hypothetical protein
MIVQTKQEQLDQLKHTISKGSIHPDNEFHSHMTMRYNELLTELNIQI